MKNFYLLILIGFFCISCSDKEEVTSFEGVVKTLMPTDTTAISAICWGLVEITQGSMDNIIESGICYSKTQNPTIDKDSMQVGMQIRGDDTIRNPKVGIYMVNLTGLQSKKTYYIRAYTKTNSDVFYGNMMSFTTLRNPIIVERDSILRMK